jgi:putative oxidoreductase
MIDSRSAPYGALLLRLAMGAMFLAHGVYLKIFVFTIPGTVGFFESLGLPGWFAWAVLAGEAGAGVALVLGLLVRLVSLLAVPILLGAAVLVHGPNGWLFSSQGGGWEFPAFWAVCLVVQALIGTGAHAVPVPGARRARP